jgi:hypothetical protein
MVVRPLLVAFSLAITACKGSVTGAVYAIDSGQPVTVAGHAVFLVSVSDEVRTVLKSVCPDGGVAAWQEKLGAERNRLRGVAAIYEDSAGEERTRRGMTQRWRQLKRLSYTHADSAMHTNADPPTIGADLIEKLSIKRASTGENGAFEFSNLPRGQYLVAADIRHEYRWVPVEVSHSKTTADVSETGSQSGCAIAGRL